MIRNFFKIKNNNLLISLFSVLFLSSCSNADISDIENRAFKCTKYVSSEKKLPEHIKNPITFVFSNEKLNYTKSIPFSEVFIKKGETKQVSFEITKNTLAFYDIEMDYCVEPGEFSIMTGGSSAVRDLKLTTLTVNNRIDVNE